MTREKFWEENRRVRERCEVSESQVFGGSNKRPEMMEGNRDIMVSARRGNSLCTDKYSVHGLPWLRGESRSTRKLIVRPLRWRRYVPPKHQLTFNIPNGVTSRKVTLCSVIC
jgi:hypothetical protein